MMEKSSKLLDPKFKYVPARNTNIAKTFARIRREQAKIEALTKATVTPIKKREAANISLAISAFP
jgi:hypothetical protein